MVLCDCLTDVDFVNITSVYQMVFCPLYHGDLKSTVDYIMVPQEDKAKIRNVKVITGEECVQRPFNGL